MKQLPLNDIPVYLEKNKLYKIPKIVSSTEAAEYAYFDFQTDIENCLYGTCIEDNQRNGYWYFERYPDKAKIYLSTASVNLAERYGIFEYESEEELIMDKMK